MVAATPRVLITGIAGFIGFHLALRLNALGLELAGLDNLNAYYDVGLKQARLAYLNKEISFRFEPIDLTDYEAVQNLFASFKPDICVHLAAQAGVRYSLTHPRSYISANLDGFLSILEACRAHPVRHLLYASSSSVYGANTKVPFHEDDPVCAPVSLYAASKRANELMAQTYAHLYAIPCSGLRFFTVYGPWGRPDMAYYRFTQAILKGEPIEVYNHGNLERDFTYIDDVTQALARLLDVVPPADHDAPHRLYNIGNHTPVTLDRFIGTIEEALGRKAIRIDRPMQPGDVPKTFADVERLRAATGFAPSTPLEEGIERFVAWYRTWQEAV